MNFDPSAVLGEPETLLQTLATLLEPSVVKIDHWALLNTQEVWRILEEREIARTAYLQDRNSAQIMKSSNQLAKTIKKNATKKAIKAVFAEFVILGNNRLGD